MTLCFQRSHSPPQSLGNSMLSSIYPDTWIIIYLVFILCHWYRSQNNPANPDKMCKKVHLSSFFIFFISHIFITNIYIIIICTSFTTIAWKSGALKGIFLEQKKKKEVKWKKKTFLGVESGLLGWWKKPWTFFQLGVGTLTCKNCWGSKNYIILFYYLLNLRRGRGLWGPLSTVGNACKLNIGQ